jgi:hypothetical protein
MNYHLHHEGKNLGEFPIEKLRERRDSGELTGRECVWREGMVQWEPLDSVLKKAAADHMSGSGPSIDGSAKSPRWGLFAFVTFASILGIVIALQLGKSAHSFIKHVREAKPPEITASAPGPKEISTDGEPPSPRGIGAFTVVTNATTSTEATVKERARKFRIRQYLEPFQHSSNNLACREESLRFLDAWLAENFGGGSANTNDLHELAEHVAKQSGCDDPIVLALAAVSGVELHSSEALLERAVSSFENSKYRAYPRFYAVVVLAKYMNDRPERRALLEDKAVELFRDSLRDGGLLSEDQAEVAESLVTGWGNQFFDRNSEAILRIIKPEEKFEWLALVLEGESEVNLAWKARGGGYANTVTEAGWRGFERHLAQAHKAFAQAWNLQPNWALAPAAMIKVAMGESGSAEMRRWFNRATAAQIDYPTAWSNMRWGLRPRWAGSAEEMLALGISALDTGRFDTDVPRKFFDVVSDLESDRELPPGNHIYGESEIWPHMQRLYEGYIRSTPGDRADGWRSTYCVVAFLAGKLDVARKQLDTLEGRIWKRNLTGWGVDLSLMPLQITALTGENGARFKEAEAAYSSRDVSLALNLYSDLKKLPGLDSSSQKLVDHRIAALNMEKRLEGGSWVDFLPESETDPNWIVVSGKPKRVRDGLEVEADKSGHLLYSRVRVGSRFEIKGEFEMVRSSTADFQAGCVMGMPEGFSSSWYGFRMKRNAVEGQIATFSRLWSAQHVFKNVELKPRNTFRVSISDGKATITVNDQEILSRSALARSAAFDESSLVGLGAFNDMNSTVVRYRSLQVRTLTWKNSNR